jgi:subtilisin family serine protease
MAKILSAKVLNDEGAGRSEDIVAGIRWAMQAGADILSLSLGSPAPDADIHLALVSAIHQGRFVITAAGNEGPDLDTVGYPAGYPEMVAVGSIDRRQRLSRFSSRGRQVDVVAPGDEITSCYPPRGFATLSGTSMATPMVAGQAALIKSNWNFLAAPDLAQIIFQSSTRLCSDNVSAAVCKTRAAADAMYGWGLINVGASLQPLGGLNLTSKTGKYVELLRQISPGSSLEKERMMARSKGKGRSRVKTEPTSGVNLDRMVLSISSAGR